MITITPTSPIVESFTVTKNVVSIVITSTLIDTVAGQVTINFNRNLDTGGAENATIILSGADALAFLSTVSNPSETLLDLGIRAASTAVAEEYGLVDPVVTNT